MKPQRSPSRALLLNLALFALAFGLFGLVLNRNWAKIQEVFARPVDLRFLGLGMAIYLTALLLTFFRWHQLVRAQGMVFAARDAARLGFIGNLFNLVIPGAVGGDVIKAAFLCRMQPDRKPQAVASMILDRILGLLGLFLLASLAGAVSWPSAHREVRLLIALVWGCSAAGMVALGIVFSPGLYRPLNRLVAGRGKLESAVRELEGIGLAYREALGRVLALLGLSMTVHGLYVLAFYSASSAIFDRMPTLAQHYLMVPLALFTTAVPLPFGALGLSEGISGQLFELVDQHEGVIAMMAFRLLMYGSGAVSALVYLANLRQVRTIAKDAGAEVEEALGEHIGGTVVEPAASATGSPG